VTIPTEIRQLLGVGPGDQISFIQNDNGEIVIKNASAQAIEDAQQAFEGVAKDLDVNNEEDVQELVDEIRNEKRLCFHHLSLQKIQSPVK